MMKAGVAAVTLIFTLGSAASATDTTPDAKLNLRRPSLGGGSRLGRRPGMDVTSRAIRQRMVSSTT